MVQDTLKRFNLLTGNNKSNTKVSAHYWIECMYSINIYNNIFSVYDFFDFFWNVFNSRAINGCCFITIDI